MVEGTSEKMFFFLVGDTELNIEAVWFNDILTVVDLHILTDSLGGHLTNRFTNSLASSLVETDPVYLVCNSLIIDGVIGILTFVRLHLLFDWCGHKFAFLPGDISAVYFAVPHLLSIAIDDPLAVATLLGHIGALRQVLVLCDVCFVWGAGFVRKLMLIDNIIGDFLLLRGLITLSVAHNLAVSDNDVLAHPLCGRLTVGRHLEVTELVNSSVELHVSIHRDVHTARVYVVIFLSNSCHKNK